MVFKLLQTIVVCWAVIIITGAILHLGLFATGYDNAADFVLQVNAAFWGLTFGSKFAKHINKEQDKKDGNS